jgi:hypothetical protein
MRVCNWIVWPAFLCGSIMATAAEAKVSAAESARLGADLTPVGAVAAGNAEGTVPAWIGSKNFDEVVKSQTPQSLEALRLQYEALRQKDPQDFDLLMQDLNKLGTDNYAAVSKQIDAIDAKLPTAAQDLSGRLRREMGGAGKYEQPLFIITKSNLAQYAANLTAGQQALFAKYPDYRMVVYPTIRNAYYPDEINRATIANAVNAELKGTDELSGAVLGFPFPIPKTGAEVIWNHKMAYRGSAVRRYNNQAIVNADGSYKISKLIEDIKFKYANLKENNAGTRILFYYLSDVLSPPRVAGQLLLVHENSGAGGSGREAWLYNPGLGRVNRAPDVGYDNPSIGTDGEQFNDQIDVFNGALDRYDWKLLGKKEIYIPYNSYFLISPLVKYKDIIRPGHVNQNLLRYELHRVWVVDATLKAGMRHQFKRRTFYVDEDGWAIAAVDCYDNRDQLWKVQESELITAPFVPVLTGLAEIIYDLQSSRYFVTALQNEDRYIDFKIDFKDEYFSPGDLNAKGQTR